MARLIPGGWAIRVVERASSAVPILEDFFFGGELAEHIFQGVGIIDIPAHVGDMQLTVKECLIVAYAVLQHGVTIAGLGCLHALCALAISQTENLVVLRHVEQRVGVLILLGAIKAIVDFERLGRLEGKARADHGEFHLARVFVAGLVVEPAIRITLGCAELEEELVRERDVDVAIQQQIAVIATACANGT